MSSILPTIMIRTQKEVVEKFKVIAADNNRSMSKEAELLIKNHIKRYELDNGEIKLDQDKT